MTSDKSNNSNHLQRSLKMEKKDKPSNSKDDATVNVDGERINNEERPADLQPLDMRDSETQESTEKTESKPKRKICLGKEELDPTDFSRIFGTICMLNERRAQPLLDQGMEKEVVQSVLETCFSIDCHTAAGQFEDIEDLREGFAIFLRGQVIDAAEKIVSEAERENSSETVQ